VQPFQAKVLHPQRSARHCATHETEAYPNTDKPNVWELRAKFLDQQILFGLAEADINKIWRCCAYETRELGNFVGIIVEVYGRAERTSHLQVGVALP
jgi:hypothetical protein